MRIRTPANLAEGLLEAVEEQGTLTQADVTRIGMQHFTGYYRAHQIAAALAADGVLQRGVGGTYSLAPRHRIGIRRLSL